MPVPSGGAKKYLPGLGKAFGVEKDELGNFNAIKDKGLSGDLVLAVTPATLGSSAAAVTTAISGAGFFRTVTIKLVTAANETHDWFSGTFAITIADTATGTAAIVGGGSTATFVNGVATVVIQYTGTWASTNTATFTVTGGTKLGYTIADKTSVDTLIA